MGMAGRFQWWHHTGKLNTHVLISLVDEIRYSVSRVISVGASQFRVNELVQGIFEDKAVVRENYFLSATTHESDSVSM